VSGRGRQRIDGGGEQERDGAKMAVGLFRFSLQVEITSAKCFASGRVWRGVAPHLPDQPHSHKTVWGHNDLHWTTIRKWPHNVARTA
jgi:hypothetical protein